MPSVFSISGANSMFFADSSSKNSNNSVSSIFGETSTLLGDYSMIKSGSYKKLLTAYYASQKTDNKSNGTSTSGSTANLVDIKTTAVKLKQSLSKLSETSLYEKKTDKVTMTEMPLQVRLKILLMPIIIILMRVEMLIRQVF